MSTPLGASAKGWAGSADTRIVGLLDNFRRVADTSATEDAEDTGLDAVTTDLPAGVPDDGPWLAGIDRRRPESTSVEQPAAPETIPSELFSQPGDAEAPQAFGVEFGGFGQPVDAGQFAGAESPSEALPDLGMVYAGLNTEGLTSVSTEPFPAWSSPAEQTGDDVGAGPVSEDAVPHLAVLGLHLGVTWDDIARVRRQELSANPPTGSAEQLQRRLEVNHASAALRLLYVP